MIMSCGRFYCHKYDSDAERESLFYSSSQFKLWKYKKKFNYVLYEYSCTGIIFSTALVERDQASI